MQTTTIRQQIAVNWEFPVTFTQRLFAVENPVLVETLDRLNEARRHRAVVFIRSEEHTSELQSQ